MIPNIEALVTWVEKNPDEVAKSAKDQSALQSFIFNGADMTNDKKIIKSKPKNFDNPQQKDLE
jgi:hypothetical protein